MAGGSDEDNPVGLNVVAMVDIIFCLCIFFMCSFRFKQLEGKFESWLPKNKGNSGAMTDAPIQEIRIAMFFDKANSRVKRLYGHRQVDDDAELETLIKGAHEDFVRVNKPDAPVIIDGEASVPWESVVTVVNIAKKVGVDKIEFALGAAEKAP
jgi:biopolymer transport protein ExbD